MICMSLVLLACDTENANDCFQKSGAIITEEISVPLFTQIVVNRDVELVLIEGVNQKVIVETGENLLNDISVTVVNEQLILKENNTCNFVRNYNITKIYVTSPNITKIISSTQFKVRSEGVLSYPNLDVYSEDFSDSSVIAVGEVELTLNSQNINVVGNNLTTFSLNGVTENLSVSLYAGDGIFNGANLAANKVTVFHRGTNKMIVNPQIELKGKMVGTGNLISKNHPSIVDVLQLYTGILVFE